MCRATVFAWYHPPTITAKRTRSEKGTEQGKSHEKWNDRKCKGGSMNEWTILAQIPLSPPPPTTTFDSEHQSSYMEGGLIDWNYSKKVGILVKNPDSKYLLTQDPRMSQTYHVWDFGSWPMSPAFSIVKRRGPSLPCKSLKPLTGIRDVPVANCKSRDFCSPSQLRIVCQKNLITSSDSVYPL